MFRDRCCSHTEGCPQGRWWVLGDLVPSRRLPKDACEHQDRTAEARFTAIPKARLGAASSVLLKIGK